MDLIYPLLICLLLKNSISMRNFHIPHEYLHKLAMQHNNYRIGMHHDYNYNLAVPHNNNYKHGMSHESNYRIGKPHSTNYKLGIPQVNNQMHQRNNNFKHYDSYDNEGMDIRSHRKKFYRNRDSSECSDSEHHYKWECKCSCTKCVNPPECCKDFCTQQCTMQSNIIVVPYPVPFIVQPNLNENISNPTATTASAATSSPTSSTTSSTSVSTTSAITKSTYPPDSITTNNIFSMTRSTIDFYIKNDLTNRLKDRFKRYRIIPADQRKRRNMGPNMRQPRFQGLPKYGIIPIPENLAINLMNQIKNDEKNEQLRKRFNTNKNRLDYGD